MLTIQFGQCGNQLGHTIHSKILADLTFLNTGVQSQRNKEYAESTYNKWFKDVSRNGEYIARAILVDAEQKVVNKICNDADSGWRYDMKNVVYDAGGGCANNWAFGYGRKGKYLGEKTVEAVRHEIERLDHFEGILFCLSSAGGTGSGVGSYTAELLRNEFPTKSVASIVVLPFTSGEVGTQNYNSLLTLSKLYDETDAVFIFENEQIHAICTNLLKNLEAKLYDINEVISQKLTALFQPLEDSQINLNYLVSRIASHPSYKLITIKSTPHIAASSTVYETSYKWETYIRHLKQTLRIPSYHNELVDVETKMPSQSFSARRSLMYSQSVSNLLITRGTSVRNDPIVGDELKEKELYTSWISEADQFKHLHQTRRLLNQEKFCALITNNSQLQKPLDTFLEKAWNAYTHSAFLHQYKRFGLEEDDFLQAFAKKENGYGSQ
ncbi:tubulin delta chain isoform X2 [Cephus cinctus]|uniref:Tubulin delta chain n=1 Tax=Cephus cinctus TaxID=211228 RepID=A0AAJ7FRB1_CEPCN|nr:tubulin delta chain isoform X2 [Cephus cinctus]